LKFLLINSRWFGGAGFRTLEHRMEEAVRNLPISSELLADLLITILEIQDRDEAKKSRCTNLSRYSRPSGAVRSPVRSTSGESRKRP
jgi:hypothetical protein